MRLDHVNHAHSTSTQAPWLPATKTAAAATSPAVTPTTGTASTDSPVRADLSYTATWQWSISLQVNLVLNGDGGATTAAPTAATDREVGEAGGERHGRSHVSQTLRQLSREVRHELQAIIRNNPDLDPAVRQELRETAKAFRDDLKAAFHDAGRGGDFDPAALLDGVQQALATLADRLGALIGEETAAAEPLPAPAPEPTPERPSEPTPTEMPVSAAA